MCQTFIKDVFLLLTSICILYFSRDFPFRSGSTLKKPQGVGRQFSSLFRRLYLSFRSKPLTHYAICRPMLSTTWWPKLKTSLVGHNCPKFSISSTKELVRFFSVFSVSISSRVHAMCAFVVRYWFSTNKWLGTLPIFSRHNPPKKHLWKI